MSKENIVVQKINKLEPIKTDTGIWHHNLAGEKVIDVNISDIMTHIVHDVGRFCEHYASDVFINHDSLMKKLDNLPENNQTEYTWFGIRESGVDDISYILCNMNNQSPEYISQYYRRLYCVKMHIESENTIVVELFDVTRDAYSLTSDVKQTNLTYEKYLESFTK